MGSVVDCGGDRINHEDYEYAMFPPHTTVKSNKRESSPSGLTPYPDIKNNGMFKNTKYI